MAQLCEKYHPLVIKDISEVITDNLVIILFIFNYKLDPNIWGTFLIYDIF